MAIEYPQLPYAENALEPYTSGQTMSFHYGKHHKAYVDTGNKLIVGTRYESMALKDIVRGSAENPIETAIFNNCAQAWNHNFFWPCMKPGGGGKPSGEVLARIERSFGSYEKFAEDFKAAAMGRFGSGWVWVIVAGDGLKIISTPNGDNAIAHGETPVLALDVWEHTYYLDYQNRRADFVQAFLDHLIDWDFVASKLPR